MKITTKILSIPPYISTSWNHISSLHVKESDTLVIALKNGSHVEIPSLDTKTLFQVFATHTKYLEEQDQGILNPANGGGVSEIAPLRIGIEGLDGIGGALQHNPQQANTPDLPIEILSKIASISKAVGVEDARILPKPEPHCNCVHCQIARAIHSGVQSSDENLKEQPTIEEVTDEDLRFRNWDVVQTNDHMYTVTNPLDSLEQYQVFLGTPIGCNCGEKNCEHIRAVLNS